jgi:SAM-dependent methyltransferase
VAGWEILRDAGGVDAGADRRWVDEMAGAYDRWLGPSVFQPFADDLGARLAPDPPSRLLELAAGTGRLTKVLTTALPGAKVTATDLNEAMVSFGRAAVPAATWRQADAMDLPFEDASFDAVACQFGVMFLPDKAAAFCGIRRVLAGSGRFFATTWGRWEDHGFECVLLAQLDDLFADRPLTFLRSTPHGYHDPAEIEADLAGTGLELVSIEHVVRSGTSTAEELAQGYCRGTPIRAEIEARADLEPTVEEMIDRMETALGTGPVTCHMTALVIEARAV